MTQQKKPADINSPPPAFLRFRSSKTFILAAVCIAIFTDLLIYGIIVPVMPYALTTRVGIPEDSVQTWNAILLACYTIALFIGSPLVGIYADHSSSRRWPLLIGLLALAASTIMLCLGRSIAVFVLGRIFQGFSAAIVWSVGFALLADTYGEKIGMAVGYSSIAMSMGLLVSPVMGGAVYNHVGYYAVYYIAFGCIFLDVILRLILIEKKVARQWIDDDEEDEEEEIDAERGMAGTAPTGEKLTHHDTSPDNAAPSAPPLQRGASNIATSNKTAKHPKLRLLKSRRTLAANFGVIIQAGVMFSWDTVLPLFVKATFGWNSTAAGLIFFCIFIPGFVSPLVGWLSDRYGAKWPSFAGFVVTIPVLVCMRFIEENTTSQKVTFGALLALLGVTLTCSNTPLMAEITYAIAAEEAKSPGIFGQKGVYGLGYGLFCTSFALGGSIGALMSGYVMAGAGWKTLMWALAVWTAGGAVVVGFFVGENTKSSQPSSSADGDDAGGSSPDPADQVVEAEKRGEGGETHGCRVTNKVSISGDTRPAAPVV